MKPTLALVSFCLSVIVSVMPAQDQDRSIEAKKAQYAMEFRLREQPMVNELEGMLGADSKMTLFAIDRNDNEWRADADGRWMGKKLFRGHIVRSSAPIDDEREREALIHALTDGIRETDGSVANCFDPAFGLTIERKTKRIDLVVCFACLQVKVYGAYADNSFVFARTHADVYIASAKRHGLSLPYGYVSHDQIIVY